MTPREVLAILAYVGGLDPRVRRNDPVETRLQAEAWHAQLRDLPEADARAAVDAHYARPGVHALMPADVTQGVRALRSARIQRAELVPPPDLDPDDTTAYRRWLLTGTRAVADGRQVAERQALPARPVAELVAATGERLSLPGGGR